MGQIRVGQGDSVTVELRRTARAKRLSLRVSTLDGRVTLTVPKHVSTSEAAAFAEEKADWIARTLTRHVAPEPVVIGSVLTIDGTARTIVRGAGRSARLFEDRIEAPEGRTGPAVQALVKGLARDRLVTASEGFAARIGLSFNRITLRDTRSRWGSCTADKNLMFSWRLILAPSEVLQYVAAHEVAHLRHMDHSPAFWTLVEQLYPDFKSQKAWLRAHGVALHRYRFSGGIDLGDAM